eukprot:4122411-Pleurochrysis_carterae.AAC.1
MPFVPAMSTTQRIEVARAMASAFEHLPAQIDGEMFDLAELSSERIAQVECSALRFPKLELCAAEAEATANGVSRAAGASLPLPAVSPPRGAGRLDASGQGVFLASCGSLALWVNESDHLAVVARDADVRGAMDASFSALAAVEKALVEQGCAMASSRRLGFLGPCPSRVGTAMRVTMRVRLPILGAHSNGTALPLVCRDMGLLLSRSTGGVGGAEKCVDEISDAIVDEVDA